MNEYIEPEAEGLYYITAKIQVKDLIRVSAVDEADAKREAVKALKDEYGTDLQGVEIIFAEETDIL